MGGSRGEAGERAEARLAELVSQAEESELGPEGRGCKKSFEQGAVCSGASSRKISP